MLSQFTNEVLSYGPTAVLPQNLNEKWMNRLQKICDDFLDSNFALDECREPTDIGDPILVACLYEILQYQRGDDVRMASGELAELGTIYALAVTMESIQRESDIGLDPPTLENILSIERIVEFKKKNPEFVHALEEYCIIKEAEESWFQSIKNKIFTAVTDN
ncbi:MAG: hypothetical protein HKM93_19525 [Desulfobacteraceae bacterium]|nr:hypothetical protein [Desulfobacteraceae bacterium]